MLESFDVLFAHFAKRPAVSGCSIAADWWCYADVQEGSAFLEARPVSKVAGPEMGLVDWVAVQLDFTDTLPFFHLEFFILALGLF